MKQDEQGKYIELADFLKFLKLATSGGRAKLLIRLGEVKVNDEIETRVRRKLRAGFVVEYKGKKYTVDVSELT